METQIYFTMQKYNHQKKILEKKPKSFKILLQLYISNLKFQHNLAKIYPLSKKNPHIKIDLLFIT
jgi:hypothetical protein